MKSQVLVKRYTRGLVNSTKDDVEFAVIGEKLHEFESLLSSQKKLKDALASHFLPVVKKVGIAKEILSRISLTAKAERFILLLVEKGRIALLPDILELLPDLWNDKKGVSAFEVFSVISLTNAQKRRLEEQLERIEKKPVFLKYKKDSSLIGGLSVRRHNLVYDASIRGDLSKIKEKISEG